MRVFVTGASGFIASAVIPELVRAGHQVTGLARSDEAAAKVRANGADVVRGELADLATLRTAAAAAEGVVHLGFVHDFKDFATASATDREAMTAMCDTLEGSDRPFVFASGVIGMAPGRVATERDSQPDAFPRAVGIKHANTFATRGVRTAEVRFSPTVHDRGDHGFMHLLIEIAKRTGVSGYLGDGAARWPAVHRSDAARLVCAALEKAPAGSTLHAVGEEGVRTGDIAALIGERLKLPVRAIAADDAQAHFGFLGMFFGLDCPVSSAATQELLSWKPTGPGLLDDLAANYF